MGRSSKDKNVEEHLRGLLRQLKSENRNLKKQLTRLEKRSHLQEPVHVWENADLDIENSFYKNEPFQKAPEQDIQKCAKCGAKANVIDLGTRKVVHCKKCGQRAIIK